MRNRSDRGFDRGRGIAAMQGLGTSIVTTFNNASSAMNG
jgi:hypothetical protein